MKKTILLVLSLIILFSLTVGLGAPAKAVSSTNNFTISNYQIDYYLGKNSDGHSTLKTVEKIDALFPLSDQNHGIERAIPQVYDGHTVHMQVMSVTDRVGKQIPYSTSKSNDNQVIRIGDANSYVYGLQHYEITYVQQDVTKYFTNNNSDEFYWDTNGTDWAVPIQSLTVNLHIQEGLGALNNKQSCYVGVAGSTTTCLLSRTTDGYTTQASNLSSSQNVTIDIGFQPKTFAVYEMTLADRVAVFWKYSFVITFLISLVLLAIFHRRYSQKTNRSHDRSTIIPEYLPPKDASVTVAASIYNKPGATFSAQLIDFAVRHYIKIYQTSEKSLFRLAQYELEIVKDIADLRDEEREILNDIFPTTAVGTRLKMDDLKNNRTSIAMKMRDNPKKLNDSIRGIYGLRARDPRQTKWFICAGIVMLILAALTLSQWFLAVAVGSFIYAYMLWPLTDKGLTLFYYLEGLKLYIKVAEQDRLKMLQSPEGAEKIDTTIDVNDPRQLVKLYERVLPYAILFGQEKDWNNQLGRYYESINQSPDWYVGTSPVFNAVIFSSAISSFNSAATYSSPTSSSSGGSGGGGFSGGGGGGGGGGGW